MTDLHPAVIRATPWPASRACACRVVTYSPRGPSQRVRPCRDAATALHAGGVGTQVSSPPLFAQMKSPRHAISTMPECGECGGPQNRDMALSTVVRGPLTCAVVLVSPYCGVTTWTILTWISLASSPPTPAERSERSGYWSTDATPTLPVSADTKYAYKLPLIVRSASPSCGGTARC
jgi:hypothetical protein